jgi:nucleotide-binding universal stress UspA family protein
MAVRAEAAPSVVEPPRACRILLAFDGSAGSLHALARAFELARDWRARLTLLTVVPRPQLPVGAVGYDPGALERDWAAQLRAAAAMAPPDVSITLRLARGSAVRAILAEAREGGHDLVVLGCEGRGPLSGRLCGVSRRVARRCPVPVFVARRELSSPQAAAAAAPLRAAAPAPPA